MFMKAYESIHWGGRGSFRMQLECQAEEREEGSPNGEKGDKTNKSKNDNVDPCIPG